MAVFDWKKRFGLKRQFWWDFFDRSFLSNFFQFIIGRWKWWHLLLSTFSLSNFVNHLVGELLIISVLSILFNTYNLTNVYSKANATVQNSSDLRSFLKILEKTLENSQKRAKIAKINHSFRDISSNSLPRSC